MGVTGIIYMATSRTSLKSYIGQTVNELDYRMHKHRRRAFNKSSKSRNTHFYCAMRKYGFDDFDWEVLYDDIPLYKLNFIECYAIEAYDTFHHGYNSTTGGEGCTGYKHNEITLKKMSKPRSAEAKSNMSKAHKGKRLTEKTRVRMSEAQRGKTKTQDHRDKIAIFISKKYLVIKPNGNTEIVVNMNKYCADKDLCPSQMCNVAMGRRIHHKGYKCEYYE